MADPPVRVLGGVGGQESEGQRPVLVFHHMEKDPFRHPQTLALLRQVQGHRAVVGGNFLSKHGVQTLKGMLQPLFINVLGPHHEGHRPQQPVSLQKRGLGIFPQQLQVRQAGQRFEEGFGEQVQERSRGAGPLRALHQAEAVQGGPAVRLELCLQRLVRVR